MEQIHECVVCDASIWPVAHGYLCDKHRILHARLSSDPVANEVLRQVAAHVFTDFPDSTWSHITYQISSKPKPGHWVVELDDILRAYGVHYEQERRGPGHDESEAA